MQNYQHLMDCLQRWNCFIPGEDTLPQGRDYDAIPFSPQAMVGLIIHSILSSRPRSNFYTDRTKIYYVKDERTGTFNSQLQQDLVREYLIAKILSYPSAGSYDEFITRFGSHDGHLRLNNFQNALQLDSVDSDKSFLASGTLTDLIQREERHLIQARLRKSLPILKELILALEQDEPLLPIYAENLMKTLSEYEPTIRSYNPNRSRILAA